jgi:hypothetical protein
MEVRTFEIKVHEMEKIMELLRYEQYIAAKLHTYLEYQKLQLKLLEEIKRKCKMLSEHRTYNKEYWRSIDPELRKTIEKYGRI